MEGEETEGEETDVRLTNSLVIAGDRVIAGRGQQPDLFGEILSEFAEIMPDLNLYSITGPMSAAFYASENYSTAGTIRAGPRPLLPKRRWRDSRQSI